MKTIPTQSIIIPIPVNQTFLQEDYQTLMLKFDELKKEISELREQKTKRSRRTREEIKKAEEEIFPLKSDGKLKARAGQPIKSYNEFTAIQNYFLNKGKMRDWALWTVGVSIGLRISDLIKLKIGWVLNRDFTFKERLSIYEKKTTKKNNPLITESIKYALTKYFDSINWNLNFDDYIFKSQKKGKMTPQYGWKLISDAGKALNIKTVINSHTMRKSFACIAFCLGKSTIDPYKMETLRVILNHDDVRTTGGYLPIIDEIRDEYRVLVSDFVLGKSGVNELSLVKKLLEDK